MPGVPMVCGVCMKLHAKGECFVDLIAAEADDTIATLRARVAELEAEREEARTLVVEATKYIVEDRAVTPRATRLERWVGRAKAYLAATPKESAMRARKTALAILDDLAGRRGIPDDLVHGDDWEQARTKADALVVDALLSERRAVLLRVAAELRAEAETSTFGSAMRLTELALKYEREAAEVK